MRKNVMLLAVAALLAVSCGSSDVDANAQGGEATTTISGDESQSALLGEWTVTTIDGTATTDPTPTMVFGADGTLGGTGGCNSYGTTFVNSADTVTFESEVAATLMACEPAIAEQEFQLFQVLNEIASGGATVAISDGGDHLMLTNASGATIEATR